MRIAIIGAGLGGLTTAYRLSQKGHRVTVFEKSARVGGLAAGFRERNWDWYLEDFFHHLFTSDNVATKLINELGLGNKLLFYRPKTSIFINGKSYQFDSPFSVLKFPHLSFSQRVRAGLITAYLRLINNWQELEKYPAKQWLKKLYGEKIFKVLWQPLLASKFGRQAGKISAAWFWTRVKKRSPRLGYLEGGFQVLIDKLLKKVKENRGEILLDCEVKSLTVSPLERQSKKEPISALKLSKGTEAERLPVFPCRVVVQSRKPPRSFDRIVVTTPTSIFLKIAPSLPTAYKRQLKKLKMIGAMSLILTLKEKFLTDNTYWLNINELGFPFVAVVEHTNLVDPIHYGGNHLLYVGGYYSQNHRYFKMTKKQILKEFLPYLKKINPKFNSSFPGLAPLAGAGIIHHSVSGNLFAQPLIPVKYSQIIPSFKTPFPQVFLANMQMVYPWDRGVNYAIELGEKVAKIITN